MGPDTPDTARAVVQMQLLGANPTPQVVGLDELPGKVHYLRGNDPQPWRTYIPTYATVHYTAVYPGVDLVYYGQCVWAGTGVGWRRVLDGAAIAGEQI